MCQSARTRDGGPSFARCDSALPAFDINKLGDDKGSSRNARLKLKSLSWRGVPKPGMSPLGTLRPPVTGGPRALFQGFLPPKAYNSAADPSGKCVSHDRPCRRFLPKPYDNGTAAILAKRTKEGIKDHELQARKFFFFEKLSRLPSTRVAPSLHFSLPASVFRCLLSCFFRRCRGASGKLQLWTENASPQIHRDHSGEGSRSWTVALAIINATGSGYLQKFGEMIAGSPHDSEAEHPLPQNLEYGDPETP
ncbi:uncharacterized protein B0T23DRAFT_415661 [Neurospora hispaniola]|uniref:Uncharacterized protein n=1 Tax=Neurospora hispaniola TaxID=588809 RepID=A0AAJ0HZX3_9PEZI|nr:hypothetical protein B0T23DRAFT_415661 [Neurospora hispaniola]